MATSQHFTCCFLDLNDESNKLLFDATCNQFGHKSNMIKAQVELNHGKTANSTMYACALKDQNGIIQGLGLFTGLVIFTICNPSIVPPAGTVELLRFFFESLKQKDVSSLQNLRMINSDQSLPKDLFPSPFCDLLTDDPPFALIPFKMEHNGGSEVEDSEVEDMDGLYRCILIENLDEKTAIPKVAEMFRMFHAEPSVHLPNMPKPNEVSSTKKAEFLMKTKTAIILSDKNQNFHGMVTWSLPFHLNETLCARITCCFTGASVRGKGFGKLLLSRAVDHLWRILNVRRIYLFANGNYPVALNFYKSFGFEQFEPQQALGVHFFE